MNAGKLTFGRGFLVGLLIAIVSWRAPVGRLSLAACHAPPRTMERGGA